MQAYSQQIEGNDGNSSVKNSAKNVLQPVWKVKQHRKKMKKAIFGQHYNYNYRKPNQSKIHRIHEYRNTQIERQNRILLQKIQCIFRKNNQKRGQFSASHAHLEHFNNIEQQNQQKQSGLRQKKRMESFNTNLIKLQKINHRYHNNSQLKNKNNHQNLYNICSQKQSSTTELKRQNHHNLTKRSSITKRNPNCKIRSMTQPQQQVTQNTLKKLNPYNYQSSSEDQHPKLKFSQLKHKKQTVHPKIMLFYGHKHISNTLFNFKIYIEGDVYKIDAQSNNLIQKMKIKQEIKMPYSDYRKIYNKQFDKDHAKIFDYLWVSKLSGLLELVGFSKKYMEKVSYTKIQIPLNSQTITQHQNSENDQQEKDKITKIDNKNTEQLQQVNKINKDQQKNKDIVRSIENKETNQHIKTVQQPFESIITQKDPYKQKQKYDNKDQHKKQEISPQKQTKIKNFQAKQVMDQQKLNTNLTKQKIQMQLIQSQPQQQKQKQNLNTNQSKQQTQLK